jgi:hypothetical protein
LAVLPALVVAVGAILRLVRYGSDIPAWGDEAGLAHCIMTNGYREILTSRGIDLMATPAFLLLLKGVTSVLGPREYSLRLPSLLAGILALPLFHLLARRFLSPAGGLLALFLVAVSEPLIHYTANAKQYMLDVLAAVALCHLAAGHREKGEPFPRALWFTGLAALLLSFEMIFVCAGIGIFLLGDALARGRRAAAGWTVLWGSGWAAVFAYHYLHRLRPIMRTSDLNAYWRDFTLPFPPLTTADASLYLSSFLRLFRDPLDLPMAVPAAILCLAGLALLLRRTPGASLLLVSPLAAYGAAALGGLAPVPTVNLGPWQPVVYPLYGRVILFVVPLVLIMLAAGLEAIPAGVGTRMRTAAWGLVLLTMAWPGYLAVSRAVRPPPSMDIRSLVGQMKPLLRPGDLIFVQSFGQIPVQFHLTLQGLDDSTRTMSNRTAADRERLKEELLGLRSGQRLWLVTLTSGFFPAIRKEKNELMGILSLAADRLATVRSHEAEAELLLVRPGYDDPLPPGG